MNKKFTVLFLIIFSLFFITRTASAQTASWPTEVGNPPNTDGVHPTPPYTPGDENHKDCDYRCAIKKEFNIQVTGYFTADTLSWFWEKLWEVSQTNFTKLISGTTIESTGGDSGYSVPTTTGIKLANYRAQYLIDLVFIHEFGHWIFNNKDGLNFAKEHANLVAADNPSETPVTNYAKPVDAAGHVCSGDSTYWVREDYAEMIAYYLNPEVSGHAVPQCAGVITNPYLNGGHPGHKRIAEMILGSF